MSCETCGGTGEVFVGSENNTHLIKCPDCSTSSKLYFHKDDPNVPKPFGYIEKQHRFHLAHMKAAEAYSELSHCVRAKVGALLVSPDNRPLLSGFNGTAPGHCNDCEDEYICSDCEGTGRVLKYHTHDANWTKCSKCKGEGKILVTKPEVNHAERNLLGYANKYGIPTNNCSIYVTMEPCIECSKQMELAGIKSVFYKHSYRDHSGIKYLKKHGVHVEQIS